MDLAQQSRMGWLAAHACPACGSANIRRSAIRSSEANAHAFRSPYRCENCKHRFWLVSRKARLGAATAGIALFSGIVFLATLLVLPRYVVPEQSEQLQAASPDTLVVHEGVVMSAPAAAAARDVAGKSSVTSAPAAVISRDVEAQSSQVSAPTAASQDRAAASTVMSATVPTKATPPAETH